MMESSLPDDLLMLILFKLPAKSLIRLKSVSKSWREIISSPSFIYHHYNHTSSAVDASEEKTSSFLVLHSQMSSKLHNYFTRFSVSVTDGEFHCKTHETFYLHHIRKKWVAHPFDAPLIYAAGFGVYCIFSFRDRTVAMWNPTIRQLKFLPSSPWSMGGPHEYGFAHVDYKDGVFSYKVGLLWRGIVGMACYETVELYSSSDNSWNLLKRCCSPKRAGQFSLVNGGFLQSGTVLNGKFHWLTLPDEDDTHICTLDISTEKISRLEISTFSRHDPHYYLHKSLLTKFEEKYLCLLLYYWKNNVKAAYLDVWIMLEYGITGSWTRKSTVGPISITEYVKVLGMSKSAGGVVIHDLDFGGGLFFYQYDSSNVQRLLFMPNNVTEWTYFVEDKESLVSFGGDSDKRIQS